MKILYTMLAIIFFWANTTAQQSEQFKLDLEVNFLDAIPDDTLILDLIDPWTLKKSLEIKSTKSSSGRFVFHATYGRPYGFWMLRLTRPGGTELMEKREISGIFLWEDKDCIALKLSTEIGKVYGHKSRYQFTGNGSLKYQLKADLNDERKFDNCIIGYKGPYFTKDFRLVNGANPCIEQQMAIVNSHKNILSDIAYQSLKNDIINKYPSGFNSTVTNYIFENPHHAAEFKHNYFKTTKDIFSTKQHPHFYYSYNSLKKFQEKLRTDLRVLIYPNKEISDHYYNFIKENSAGEARERLLIHYFSYYRPATNVDSLVNDAIPLFQSREGIEEIQKLKLPFPRSIGEGFQFTDHDGNIFNLDSLHGKVILIDVYNPGCAPCATLFKNSISKIKKEFANNPKFVVLSVSVERNNERWQKSLKSGLYTSFSNNTINVYTGPSGKDHPFLKLNKWSYNPSIFLIDSDGNTRYFNNEFFFNFEKLKPIVQDLL